MSEEKVVVYKKHSLAVRWAHWLNFPLVFIMIISGLMIYWANYIYTPFIPRSVYNLFGLNQQLGLGIAIHFFFMWLFAINGFVYTLYLLISGEWRQIVPKLSSLKDAFLVVLHDLKLTKKLPAQGKFNGAQKIAYTSMSILGFLQLLTGLAIYKPVQLQPLLLLFGGYESTRFFHFVITVLFVLFFVVHIAQVVRAGWNNFRSMITGTEKIIDGQNKIILTQKEFKHRNRRSFIVAGVAAAAGLLGLRFILTAESDNGVPGPLRKGFNANESFWRKLFNPHQENSAVQAPPPGTPARVNGDIGLDGEFDLASWRLEYESPTLKKTFTLDDLKKFSRSSSQAEFRCIEGWSMPIGYEGIRFSDFLNAVDPESKKMSYVGLETPEADYYVSVDMESMLHSQTVLADRMNGEPLGKEHGEPLRLIIPLKYGIKHLKRIGRIFVSNERPPDYWAENGYDWYSGH